MQLKWLVAHDFSEEAGNALKRAAEQLTALGGGELILAHVHAPLSTGFGIDLGATTAFHDVDRALDAEARARLTALGEAISPLYPKLTVRCVVETGHPAEHLVELAHRESVDQIVLGSHGRRGLQRFFLGSVAERVLRLADRPVLVVKSSIETDS
jgi:nucleotide-binding universal stress UspA family protein